MADPVDEPGAAATQAMMREDGSTAADLAIAVGLLAQSQIVPKAFIAALKGPLGDAAATADLHAGRVLGDATKQAYRRDWVHFAAWSRQQAVDPAALPIHPVLVAAYLASLAGTLGQSALNGRLAAIAYEHRRRGLMWNAGHPAIRETLRGIDRAHHRPARPAAALTAVEIERLLEVCPQDVAGLRDRALFLVGFSGALRRSALVAIDHADLRFEAGHVSIRITRARLDRTEITLPRVRNGAGEVGAMCPVQALERWLARSKIRRGAVFRSVTVGGRLGDRLSPDGVRHVLLSRAKLADIPIAPGMRLSPHGLRAGAVRGRAARPPGA